MTTKTANPTSLDSLPGPVATYLAAEKNKDTAMLDQCFAEDARVFDESHDYRGLEAIKTWKREANEKYQYVVEPLDAQVKGDSVSVRARLTGNFPGSPAELGFAFTLANDKIIALEIG